MIPGVVEAHDYFAKRSVVAVLTLTPCEMGLLHDVAQATGESCSQVVGRLLVAEERKHHDGMRHDLG